MNIQSEPKPDPELIAADFSLVALLNAMPEIVFELDEHGRFTHVWAYHVDEAVLPTGYVLGHLLEDVLPTDAAHLCRIALQEAATKGHSHGQWMSLSMPTGLHWFELKIIRKVQHDGAVRFMLLTHNVTTHRHTQEALKKAIAHKQELLRESDRMRQVYLSMLEDQALATAKLRQAASVFEHTHEGICITDENGVILNVNRAFSQITGYDKCEVLGKKISLLKSGRHDAEFYKAMWQALSTTGHWSSEIWNRSKSGHIFPEKLTISAVKDDTGRTTSYVGLFADISALKEQEQKLERMAHYDVLTHLPNRALLADRLQQAMARIRRSEAMLAVVYLDLDGFKKVNDTYGHEAGDGLLTVLGARMQQVLRTGDTLARIGGDEFVAVLIDLPQREACLPVVERLLQAAAAPVVIDDHALQVSASIGVSFFPESNPQIEADQLMRQADQAMYQAKQAGRNRYQLFYPSE